MDKPEKSPECGEGADLSDEIESLRAQMETKNEELSRQAALSQDYLDTARRVQAEFENYKKRAAKEKEMIMSCANERLLFDILIVYDDL